MKKNQFNFKWLLNLLLICLFTPPHFSFAQVTVPSGIHVWDDLTDLPAGYQTGIIFSPNADVTIEGNLTILMNANTSIILEPGAKVFTRQSVVFNVNSSTDAWNGIVIKSNSTISQGTSYTAVNTTAGVGYLKLTDNTQIKNAVTGVAVGDPNISGFNGGVLQAEDSKFMNCKYAVYFYPYQDPVNNDKNLSYFRRNLFEWDIDTYKSILFDPPSGLPLISNKFMSLVTLDDVQGISFRGNTFINKSEWHKWPGSDYINGISTLQEPARGIGIKSISSSFVVMNDGPCGYDNSLPAPSPNCIFCIGQNDHFEGLFSGILIRKKDNSTRYADIRYATFENNFNGIISTSTKPEAPTPLITFDVQNVYVAFCKFLINIGYYTYSHKPNLQTNGVAFHNTRNFYIKNNTFDFNSINPAGGTGQVCSIQSPFIDWLETGAGNTQTNTTTGICLSNCGSTSNTSFVFGNNFKMRWVTYCDAKVAGLHLRGHNTNIVIDYNEFDIVPVPSGVKKLFDIYFSPNNTGDNSFSSGCVGGAMRNIFSTIHTAGENEIYDQYHIGFANPENTPYFWQITGNEFTIPYTYDNSFVLVDPLLQASLIPTKIDYPSTINGPETFPHIVVTPSVEPTPCPKPNICGFFDIPTEGIIPDEGNGSIRKNVTETDLLGANVYPNPTNSLLHIDFYGNSIAHIRITDIAGAVIFTLTTENIENSIDLSGFKSGMYFVEILDKNFSKVTVKKIIKH